MNLVGYSVDPTPKDRPTLFLLVPKEDRERTWYVCTETPEERSEWIEIFQEACLKARNPLNSDTLLREAFCQAYRALLASYGMRVGEPDDTEVASLSVVMVDRFASSFMHLIFSFRFLLLFSVFLLHIYTIFFLCPQATADLFAANPK